MKDYFKNAIKNPRFVEDSKDIIIIKDFIIHSYFDDVDYLELHQSAENVIKLPIETLEAHARVQRFAFYPEVREKLSIIFDTIDIQKRELEELHSDNTYLNLQLSEWRKREYYQNQSIESFEKASLWERIKKAFKGEL